jgi:HAD superfamily hydrolase (TIGR01549 family)
MMETKPFKLIIFDIDNTLIYRSPRPAEVLLEFVQEKGLPTYPDALQRGERRNFAYYADGQADEERASFGEVYFRRSYVAALLQAMCTADEVEHWLDEALAHLDETPRVTHCPDSVREMVQLLYEVGYHLAAISNRDGDLRPLLTTYGLSKYFIFALSGGRAGVYKPDPEIFCIALRTLGVAPAAAVAIGDSYDADVVGARRANITPILLDPNDIFPEAHCRRIKGMEELVPWLVPSIPDQWRFNVVKLRRESSL